MRAARVLSTGLWLLTSACSWSRFDDLSDSAPVVELEKADAVRAGFGSALATARVEDRVRLLATGTPGGNGGAVYNLGTGDQPNTSAVDTHHCPSDGACRLARQPAGLGLVASPVGGDAELCFVSGLRAGAAAGNGLQVRCADDSTNVLPIPGPVQDAVAASLQRPPDLAVALGADRDLAPALAAGLPVVPAAWFYAPRSLVPVELLPPATPIDESYGTTVAVVRGADARVLAVGAPAQNHVWLFRTDATGGAGPIGCLGGPSGFGKALTSGHVNRDEVDELVVADDVNVTVLDGAALLALDAAGSGCSLASLPAATLLASFGCGTTRDVAGCVDSDFGAAIAVGDIDGDGDGGIIVGAPRMKVRDVRRAGALLLYDVTQDASSPLAGAYFLSSADAGDLLGSALATPEIDDRHIVAAGAPGGAKVAVFYCNGLLPAELQGHRCR